MFAAAVIGDFFIFRVIWLILIGFIRYLICLCQGYRPITIKREKDIKKLMNNAVKDMFNRKKL